MKRTKRGINSVCRVVPRRTRSHERLLIGQPRVRIEQVVDVDTDQGAGTPESQDLADSHVHLPDVVAVQLTGLQQVDRLLVVQQRDSSDRVGHDVVGVDRVTVLAESLPPRPSVPGLNWKLADNCTSIFGTT